MDKDHGIRAKKPPMKDFNKDGGADRIKKQQAFELRFKSLEAQQAAREAEVDALEERKNIESKYVKAVEKAEKILDGLPRYQPIPPEVGRYLQEGLKAARETRQQRLDLVAAELEITLEEIHTCEVKDLELVKAQLTYVVPPGPTPDVADAFNRAATNRDHQQLEAHRPAEFNRVARGIDLRIDRGGIDI